MAHALLGAPLTCHPLTPTKLMVTNFKKLSMLTFMESWME